MRLRAFWWVWLGLAIHFILGQIILVLWGLGPYIVWISSGVLMGYALGKLALRKKKKERLAAWRKSHPDMPDFWIPEGLRDHD